MNNSIPTIGLPYRGVYPRSYSYDTAMAFPEGFAWGLGTAAYQVEGGWKEGGRGPSIWDTYSGADGSNPNTLMEAAGDTGAVACDHYHQWRQDVALMADLGLRHYRFSISWSRILPNGTLSGGVNEEGVAFYSALIDALLVHNITPFVTLYHWDLPQALQTASLPGWLDRALVPLFVDFADLCFSRFADRVKHWTTFNEPWTFVVLGYGSGSKAPGYPYTDIARGPYLAGHHVLLAHARAVGAFRTARHSGQIGITNNLDWREPLSSAAADIAAAERALLWWLGWFADPIWRGDYPPEMRAKLGSRLPLFNAEERAALLGSSDFFGLNHYGSAFCTNSPTAADYDLAGGTPPSYWSDAEAAVIHTPEMPQASSVWLYSVPWGLRKALSWIARRYGSPPIYITENGWSTPGDEPAALGVVDPGRVLFLANYTSEVHRAIYEDGVDVRGYFAWSLMDNFEWEMGYSERFGLVYVEYETLRRFPKASARWYSELMRTNALVDPSPYLPKPSVKGEEGNALSELDDRAQTWRRGLVAFAMASALVSAVGVVVAVRRQHQNRLDRRWGSGVGASPLSVVEPDPATEDRVSELIRGAMAESEDQ